jgi:hypothetical protein
MRSLSYSPSCSLYTLPVPYQRARRQRPHPSHPICTFLHLGVNLCIAPFTLMDSSRQQCFFGVVAATHQRDITYVYQEMVQAASHHAHICPNQWVGGRRFVSFGVVGTTGCSATGRGVRRVLDSTLLTRARNENLCRWQQGGWPGL